MNSEHWNKVDELLGAVLELAPEVRSTYLADQCGGDVGLRVEVEKLVAAHERAGKFIETSAMNVVARAVASDTLRTRMREKIGPYRVISLLGVGGMGEVYLAKDSRLARKVALKILPAPFTFDTDRIRRFEQEARAASALNHPNIVTVYDIGEHDGIHYIATDYSEGETLRTRLTRGPMPLAEAVRAAVQMAEALGAAHAAGITHRDIKPENIVLRNDGYVKVLDFGLAKLAKQPVVTGSLSLPPLSQSGIVAGTVKYMSPEQARGDDVDARTDLWSLGVLLYETVTGKSPFEGKSQASVFDAILNRTPTPVTELNESLPSNLESIINRALEKDPELRYQTAADMRADLRRLERMSKASSSRLSRTMTRLKGDRTYGIGWRVIAAIAIAVAALVAIFSFLFSKQEEQVQRVGGPDWTSAKSIQLTTGAGPEFYPVLAADEKMFLYASPASGNWDIYWQRMGGKNPVNLTRDSLADDTQPSYSPDGVYIAFRSERTPAGIYVMEATSENVRRVSDTGYNPAWSPDGKELVVGGDSPSTPTIRRLVPSPLWVIDVASATKKLLMDGDAVQPSWSPNGHRIAYWGLQPGSGQRDIWTMPAQGGPAVPVTNDDALDWNPLWSPDGKYLYFASNRGGSMNFWRVLIDEKTGETKGEPESVTTPSGYSHHLSFSRDGSRMAYVQRNETQNLHRIALDPIKQQTVGDAETVIQGTEYVSEPDISPAGDWLVYSSQGERQEDIYLIKTDGSARRQLTNDRFNDRSPRWSPDGSRITFYSDRSGRYEIWVINVDGAGLHQLTFTSGTSAVYPIWSADSTRIVFKQRNKLPFIIDANKSSSGPEIEQLQRSEQVNENFWAWSWSGDGTRIAGQASVNGRNMVVIYHLATKTYDAITPGTRPVWSKDNRGLFVNHEQGIHYVDIETKKAHLLISFPQHELRSVCLAPDGRSLYVTLRTVEADIWLLTLAEPQAKLN